MTTMSWLLQSDISKVYYCLGDSWCDSSADRDIFNGEAVLMPYPGHFPEDCPPHDTCEATGIVYRFISRHHPRARDFRSKWEEKPGTNFGDKLCMACGISVYTDLAEVIRLRQFNAALRRKFVASGCLSPDWGEILHTDTKGSHHTWWVPTDRPAWMIFETIDLVDE